MTTYKKPATSKLVMRFDNELKAILTNDLNSFMSRNPFLARKKQAAINNTLSVA